MLPETRRIVTGHDKDGMSIILSDGPATRVTQRNHFGVRAENHGLRFQEMWNTPASPVKIDAASGEPAEAETLVLKPPAGGTRMRIMDYPPRNQPTSHHRREQIEYGIVLTGQIYLITDLKETLVKAGDIVIQCGANHAWWNRFDDWCRIAFTMVDGRYAGQLEGQTEANELAAKRTAAYRSGALAPYRHYRPGA